MTELEFAHAYLNALEKYYDEYFNSKGYGIMDCVAVKGKILITVHIINDHLPDEIKYRIETMFWKE